jgi:hypothetical protein
LQQLLLVAVVAGWRMAVADAVVVVLGVAGDVVGDAPVAAVLE